MKRFALLVFIVMLLALPVMTVIAGANAYASPMLIAEAGDGLPTDTNSETASAVTDVEKPDLLTNINSFLSILGRMLPWLLFLTVVFIALWVYFDADRRTNYGWVWGIASLLIIPWIVYLLWRPILTKEEQAIIESDTRLRRVESDYYQYVLSKEKHICPVCGTPISDDYQVCPNCFKQLKMVCPNCNRLLETDWKVCPYCTTRVRKREE